MKQLIDRLQLANPGWREWDDLIALVESLSFEQASDEHLGIFYIADRPLAFSDPAARGSWPAWLPGYVPALVGLKADHWEMAGGYADSFCNKPAMKGAIFSPADNDKALGYPLIDVPPGVYAFQSNSSGARIFMSKDMVMLYPNLSGKYFQRLDTLEEFTKKNISQALAGKKWFDAFPNLKGMLLD